MIMTLLETNELFDDATSKVFHHIKLKKTNLNTEMLNIIKIKEHVDQ